jgi:CDP-diacylglycerol--glycerol-3-phosphate 3-phosphatidyltransferase
MRTAPPPSGLYALKPWYSARLAVVTRWAVTHRISPDWFTGAGIGAGAGGGLSVALGCWPAAALLLAARLAGANLDGAVARARGVSRPWGFVLNEVGDRLSDLLVCAGLAVLALRTDGAGTACLVLVAAVAASLPTFAALAAAGAGASRSNGGPFGKTERCLAAVVAAAAPGLLGGIAGAVIAGSLLTAGLRLRAAHRELTSSGGVA